MGGKETKKSKKKKETPLKWIDGRIRDQTTRMMSRLDTMEKSRTTLSDGTRFPALGVGLGLGLLGSSDSDYHFFSFSLFHSFHLFHFPPLFF